ncbi:MAG: hypothetical protein KDD44_07670, partial [Bdellovibrionales bacterium]|nr:hypothetical protein [Bdellovibrionales bacterium]
MIRRRKMEALHQVSSTAWMVTFSDLLTLLLTLFVMRLSMSSLNSSQIVELIRRGPLDEEVVQTDITPGGAPQDGDGTATQGSETPERTL